MSIILNEMIVSKGRKVDFVFKNLYSKVIDLLKEEGGLTFPEIVNKLGLENGDRGILLDVLRKLEMDSKIKSSKEQITIKGGINLTSKFFL